MAENDQHFNIQELAEKWAQGKLSPEEQAYLEKWYAQFDDANINLRGSRHDNSDELRKAMLDQIVERIDMQQYPIRKLLPWRRIAAAASILIFIGIGSYFLLHKKPAVQVASNDVAPFTKQAILKTGHGERLLLDSSHKGNIAQYANTHIQQIKGDRVAYTDNSAIDEKVIFDTLQVPAGGRPYHLQLADGSKIIVNVASSLRFPENFRKNNNEVQLLAGEAFFSITHNASAPLITKAKGQLIEDVGTEFNVNTYDDEPDSRTTLISGAVKVNAKTLIPGQQAIVIDGGLVVAKANLVEVTAWKDGYFRFNGEHIQAVMRELARWYNVEVVYEGKTTQVGFFVRISRSKNISEVLKVLERTNGVHFKIEGRRVTVLGKK